MTLRWPLAVLLALTVSGSLSAQGPSPAVRVAEILEASGDVEISRGPGAPWTSARTGQELVGTDAVRTRASAFARIKFEAGLQWMLRAASQMELRAAVAGATNANTIRVRLESGKAVASWTPNRASAAKAGSVAPRAIIETPSGNASVLGTEWSLNVEDDGRTALVVLTGSVELSNALGAVTVGANEAAEMRVGFPPTLLRIVSPGDRVQWVADYTAQPLRYADAAAETARADFDLSAADAAAGRTTLAIERLARVTTTAAASPGVKLALADLLIAAGELERARVQLEEGRRQHAMDARFDALLARVALFEGRAADSRALATQATVKDPREIDGWLALGESAQSDGDGPIARQAFQRATTVNSDDARGWFGLGSVETEYEAFVPARRSLNRALAIDPRGPGYRGEMGTVETLANNFGAAEREFAQALANRRDDYVALTGRALLALKQGHEADALDLLLRATLLEPNYARAQVYLGVTYYRLRRHDDAIRALTKATQLDAKDPLPYLMAAAIYTDLYQPSLAMAIGRKARELMPNLKSLNQLASTQKGTANLGSAVAFFGMERWAQHLAQESYYPFWAGSHLFLGDRYASKLAQASEYYEGLLTDPTVFGGSPMYQTLLPRAGSYATGEVAFGKDGAGVRQGIGILTANGYLNRTMPIGYAVSLRGGRGEAARPAASGTHTPLSGSVAVGATPSPRWNFFATGAIARERDRFLADLGEDALIDTRWSKAGRHFDSGVNFKPSPVSSAALRVGFGTIEADLPIGGSVPILSFRSRPSEVQARYTSLVASRHQLTAGFALASDHEALDLQYRDDADVAQARREMNSAQLFVSSRSQLGRATVQADVFVHRDRVNLATNDAEVHETLRGFEVRPRVGVALRMGAGVLRAAFQSQTRSWVAQSTLAPVATAGIPLDDQFVQPGGNQRRGRAQLDWEWSPRTFTSLFAEHQRIENRVKLNLIEKYQRGVRQHIGDSDDSASSGVSAALTDLRAITQDGSRLNVTRLGLLEGDTDAADGRLTAVGMALNHVVATQVSLSALYRLVGSSGTSTNTVGPVDASRGEVLSYLPRHTLSVGATWVSPRRLYLSAEAIHRSDSRNAYTYRPDLTYVREVRPADWSGRLSGFWESHDKRWAVEFAALNLLARSAAPSYGVTMKVRR